MTEVNRIIQGDDWNGIPESPVSCTNAAEKILEFIETHLTVTQMGEECLLDFDIDVAANIINREICLADPSWAQERAIEAIRAAAPLFAETK